MALVDEAERLDGALAPVFGIGLVLVQAIDVEARHVDARVAVHDPVGHDAADATAAENSDRVEARSDEVVVELGRLADDGLEVGREALGPAEEFLDARLEGDGHAAHRLLQVGPHAVPVGRDLAEGEVVRDAPDVPRRAHRLEQADQQAAGLLAEVAVGGRVLQHRQVRRQVRDLLRDEIVVLGRLVGDGDACRFAELARPHAGAVDDILGGDVAERRLDAGDAPALPQHAGDGHALDDAGTREARALGERHGDVDRVRAAVVLDVEAGENVVHARQWKQALHLSRRDLVHVDAAEAIEGRDPAVLLQPVGVGGDLDEADRLEAGRLAGLRLEAAVEVAGVLPELGGGLRGGAEGDHQAGGVPCGPAGEAVALQQHDIAPAEMRQVIGDRGADDAAADHHDAGAIRQHRCGHGLSRRSGFATVSLDSRSAGKTRPSADCS